MKKLLLTLLPLAFMVAACGGQTPEASTSRATGLSTSKNPETTSRATGLSVSTEGDTSTSAPTESTSQATGLSTSATTDQNTINLTFNLSAFDTWNPAPDNFKIHAWTATGPLYTWESADELIDENNTKVLNTEENITGFNIIFYQSATLKQSDGEEATTHTLEVGKSYLITVNPSDWGSGQKANCFYGGVTVVEANAD